MNKLGGLAILGATAALWAMPSAMAGSFPLNGPHFNLIIKGSKDVCQKPSLTNSDRHTIFVPLVTSNDPPIVNPNGEPDAVAGDTAIYLIQTPLGTIGVQNLFDVCDGNSCNPPVDCLGNPVPIGKGPTNGATFQLPCDTFVASTGTLTSCANTPGASTSYQIFAEALGTPGGKAVITTCATDTAVMPNVLVCSTTNSGLLVRNTGKPLVEDVTAALTTLTCTSKTCPTVCASGQCTFELFAPGFLGFFWDYDNLNLKTLQMRMYLTPS